MCVCALQETLALSVGDFLSSLRSPGGFRPHTHRKGTSTATNSTAPTASPVTVTSPGSVKSPRFFDTAASGSASVLLGARTRKSVSGREGVKAKVCVSVSVSVLCLRRLVSV